MNSNRRVLIFADWDNTFYSAKTVNRKLDWLKLRDYLANYREGRELIEMVLYIGLPPDRARCQEVRKQREKHIYWAKSNGFLGMKMYLIRRYLARIVDRLILCSQTDLKFN